MLVLFAFVLAIQSSLVHGDSSVASLGVCTRLLRAVTHVPRTARSEEPVRSFFMTFDGVRVDASLGAFSGQLIDYAGPRSLAELPTAAPLATAKRLDSARRYRALFEQAARTGEDFTLAKLHAAIDRVNGVIGDALTSGRRGDASFATLRTDHAFEDALTALKASWSALSPANRAASLDWLGRELVEGLSAHRTYRVDLSNVDQGVDLAPHRPPTFPNARPALAAYLNRHAAEAPVDQLRLRYYRLVASRVVGIYGIGSPATDDFARLLTSLVSDDETSNL